MEVVRAHFRPEFLNRLDEIILFHRLAADHMGPIVDIQVARLGKLLADRKIRWSSATAPAPGLGASATTRSTAPGRSSARAEISAGPARRRIAARRVRDGQVVTVDEGEGRLVLNAPGPSLDKGA
jgi:ATP-dependent Clp protease ATP-binding subunit ClpB